MRASGRCPRKHSADPGLCGQALLGRYSRAEDVVVGTPLANRSRPELEGLIGYFVNTVALRIDLSGVPRSGALCRPWHLQHSQPGA